MRRRRPRPPNIILVPGTYTAPDGAVGFVLPIALVSEANAHEHWRKRQKRAKSQRGLTTFWLRAYRRSPPQVPLVVTIVRVAPREVDSDNLVGSAKHVRDGVADYLGVNDRSKDVVWVVRQEKGPPRTYGTKVEIRAWDREKEA